MSSLIKGAKSPELILALSPNEEPSCVSSPGEREKVDFICSYHRNLPDR